MTGYTSPKIYKGEGGYLELLGDVLYYGTDTPDRTDVGECRKLFNKTLWFDLRESQPVITHRPISTRWAFEEFWFFMSGETDTKILEEKGITLWKGNTSREFLDDRGLDYLPEGDMGSAYGYQWRGFGQDGPVDINYYLGVDQLQQAYELLTEDPYSRRNLTTFWNPEQSEEMALLPCYYQHKFNVEKVGNGKDVLHMTVHSRSADLPFGLPYNLTQYGIYLKAMAESVGMEAGNMVIHIDDAHIYKNQIRWVEETLGRKFYNFVKINLEITKPLNCLDDLVNLKYEDLKFSGYAVNKTPYVTPRPPMAI